MLTRYNQVHRFRGAAVSVLANGCIRLTAAAVREFGLDGTRWAYLLADDAVANRFAIQPLDSRQPGAARIGRDNKITAARFLETSRVGNGWYRVERDESGLLVCTPHE
jgi:hypothetical protein